MRVRKQRRIEQRRAAPAIAAEDPVVRPSFAAGLRREHQREGLERGRGAHVHVVDVQRVGGRCREEDLFARRGCQGVAQRRLRDGACGGGRDVQRLRHVGVQGREV